mgnify:CR=1 FL=1
MSTFYSDGITDAINNGLLNLGSFTIEVREGDGSLWAGPNGGVVNQTDQAWTGSGATLPVDDTTLFTDRTAQGDTEIQSLYYKDDSSGQGYFEIDNGGENGIGIGTDVTLKTGSLDAVNIGLANILREGLSSVTLTVVIKNGSGTELASQSISMTWDAQDEKFTNDSEVTFNNGTGNPWSVEEVEVDANSDVMLEDSSISTGVADGGSITFSTIELSIDNLT